MDGGAPRIGRMRDSPPTRNAGLAGCRREPRGHSDAGVAPSLTMFSPAAPRPMTDPSAAPPAVLTFAATDPTSGAGLQADILTLASMGCHPLSVVTAVTVQDTAGV